MRRPSENDEVTKSNKPSPRKGSTTKGRSRKRKLKAKDFKDRDPAKAAANASNDPAWYSTSPELLRDAASIPFSWATGTPFSRNYDILYGNTTVPGVATIELVQALGETDSRFDPVNVASDAIYSFVRHANSGHSNYDAPDLMMYLMGMSSIYSFITWCQRLLGIIMTYDQRNRYLPDTLIRANWVDPDSVRNNIANFRFWLNTFISKAASFAIPNVMPYFSRMAFLYSNYYIDGPSIKDQFYMYVPTRDIKFLRFSISSSTSLGFLKYEPMISGDTYASVSTIMNYGDQLFARMWGQEDFGIMSGDILKAYGDNIIKLAPMPEMVIMQPMYDTMFLHQFKNAKVLSPGWVFLGDIAVNESGYISQQVRFSNVLTPEMLKAVEEYYSMEHILSSDFDSPTPEVVIESTRLMPTVKDVSSDDRGIVCGSELPLCLNYWINRSDMTPVLKREGGSLQFGIIENYPTVSLDRVLKLASWIDMGMNFKYAPEMNIYWGELGSLGMVTSPNKLFRNWDIDNYAVLNNEDLIKMHQTAMMSMLAVPSIAKIS